MRVAETVKNLSVRKESLKNKKFGKLVFGYAVSFIGGLLYSFSGFGEGFSPFGVSFVCGVRSRYMMSAVCGAVIGYFVSLDGVSALRYTAAVLAMTVIMGALRPFGDIRNNEITSVAVSGVCIFVTGLAIAVADGISPLGILLCFSESVVGAAAAFAFSRFFNALNMQGGLMCLNSKDAVSLAVCITLLLLSLDSISIGSVFPARIIASGLILICAYYARESGGAIVGICTGITLALGGGNIYVPCFYSLGGMLGGVFSRYGKLASFSAFLFSGITITLIFFGSVNVIPLMIETLVSGVVFWFLSSKWGTHFEKILAPTVTSPVIDSVRSDIISKLKKASAFSAEICANVTAVNDVLTKNDKNGVSDILNKTKNAVCGSCGLYDVCWSESRETTKSNFETLLNLKRQGVYLEYRTCPQSFASGCIRTENICSNLNKFYSEYKMKQKTEDRIKEIHNLASEQFLNVSSLLESLSNNIERKVRFDMDMSAKIRMLAVNCGLDVAECCCVINDMDIMRVELRINKPYDSKLFPSVADRLQDIADRKFDLPERDEYSDCVRLIYEEKPEFKIVSAGVQYTSNGEKYSGDCFTTFKDGDGYFYAVLCDGMGTGSNAAVTSALAVNLLEKLIKAGFGITSSIKTVNSSLVSKSGDECSVTLDMVVVDLYTGHTEFYKCGAADTLVRRHGRVVDVGFDSLPLGILREVEVSSGRGTLSSGDVVVMCTDGVREEDYYQLRNALKMFNEGDVRKFTTTVGETIRHTQPEKNDDMTLLTLAVASN